MAWNEEVNTPDKSQGLNIKKRKLRGSNSLLIGGL